MTDSGSSGGSSGGGRKPRLGRGLSSLLGEDEDETRQLDRLRQSRSIPIEQIEPAPYQPRRKFDEDHLKDLSESIREKGVLQPILLRRSPSSDGYEIIAGERRWRAAQLAQLHEVPALVREFDDDEALEIALIENLQREDLTPLEEAEAFLRLVEDHGQTQDQVARAISKSRSHVANAIRLLALPDSVKALVDDGKLSAGHARALLGADDPASLAEEVLRKELTVRETERLVQRARKGETDDSESGTGRPSPSAAAPSAGRGAGREKDADTLALERDLSLTTGLRVEIDSTTAQSGVLVIHYDTLDQLDDLMERLTRPLSTGHDIASPGPFAGHIANGLPFGEEDDGDLDSGESDDDDVGFTDLLAQTEALLSGSDADDEIADSEESEALADPDRDNRPVSPEGDEEEDHDGPVAASAPPTEDEPSIASPDVVAAASTTHPSSPDPDDDLDLAVVDAPLEDAIGTHDADSMADADDDGSSLKERTETSSRPADTHEEEVEQDDGEDDSRADDDVGEIDLADLDLTTIGLEDIDLDDELGEDESDEEAEASGHAGDDAGKSGESDFGADELIVEDEGPRKPD